MHLPLQCATQESPSWTSGSAVPIGVLQPSFMRSSAVAITPTMETQGERPEPATRAAGSGPTRPLMRIRRKEDHSAEPTGDTLTLERDEATDLAPFTGTEADKPVVAFEAPPVKASPTKPRLGTVLVARGIVTESQVNAALEAQANSGKRLGEALVDIGALDERGLADALADYFGMPVTDLRRDTPEPTALALVPADVAREQMAIPIRVDDDALLHVAVAQPSDDLRFLLTDISGHSVRLSLAPMNDIRWAIDRSYQAIDSVGQLVQAFEAVETSRKRPVVEEGPRRSSPTTRRWSRWSTHLHPGRARPGLRRAHRAVQDVIHVRFRIDGALKDVLELPPPWASAWSAASRSWPEMNIVETPPPPGRPVHHDRSTARRSTSGSPPSPPSGARTASCGSWTRTARCSGSTTWACRPTPTRRTPS